MKSRFSIRTRLIVGAVELMGLLLAALLLAGCDRDTLTEPEPPASLRLHFDLGAFGLPASLRAGDCLTIMDAAVLRIDGVQRARLPLAPSDTLQVTFEQVTVPLGAEIEAEIVSNNGTSLFRNSVVFGGQERVEIAVVPQAPVLWVCPASLTVDQVATSFQLLNRGAGTLSWSLVPSALVEVTPAQGDVRAGGAMRAQVARAAGSAASLQLQIETDEGRVALPVQLGANGPPVLIESLPDVALMPGEEFGLFLPPFFNDPEDDPLTFSAVSDDPSVAAVVVQNGQLVITAGIEGATEVVVSAADPFNPPVEGRLTVTVEAGNGPPFLVEPIPDQTLLPGNEVQLGLLNHFADPDNDPLNFTATSNNLSVAEVSIVPGSVLRVMAVDNGVAEVTVTASDGNHPPVPHTFRVTVTDDVYELFFIPGSGSGAAAFCRIDDDGELLLEVVNAGNAPVPTDFVVQVDFAFNASIQRTVAAGLPPAVITRFAVPIPDSCFAPECDFFLRLDVNNDVPEVDEANNVVFGRCG